MSAKKEQIYSNEGVNNACNDVSQIIVNYLQQQNIEISTSEKNHLVEEIYDEILSSLDVIIAYSYKAGFTDGLKFQQIMKEMK